MLLIHLLHVNIFHNNYSTMTDDRPTKYARLLADADADDGGISWDNLPDYLYFNDKFCAFCGQIRQYRNEECHYCGGVAYDPYNYVYPFNDCDDFLLDY